MEEDQNDEKKKGEGTEEKAKAVEASKNENTAGPADGMKKADKKEKKEKKTKKEKKDSQDQRTDGKRKQLDAALTAPCAKASKVEETQQGMPASEVANRKEEKKDVGKKNKVNPQTRSETEQEPVKKTRSQDSGVQGMMVPQTRGSYFSK